MNVNIDAIDTGIGVREPKGHGDDDDGNHVEDAEAQHGRYRTQRVHACGDHSDRSSAQQNAPSAMGLHTPLTQVRHISRRRYRRAEAASRIERGQAIAPNTIRQMPIGKLLVANRGEIALRIFRTCGELGIAHGGGGRARDDRRSLHARSADETVEIESYLFSEEHIRAAKQSGADAIHPGYGFLAENADFAAAVAAAGLTWVGPPAEALRLGGGELRREEDRRRGGRPVVPTGEPDELGFPLLVEAAAGGGGRGMRVVREPGELDEALAAAEREAVGAFGDGTLYCERYLERPRHVEVQLLGRLARHGGRARRARLLGAATAPEGARGGSGPRGSPTDLRPPAARRGRGVRPRDRDR